MATWLPAAETVGNSWAIVAWIVDPDEVSRSNLDPLVQGHQERLQELNSFKMYIVAVYTRRNGKKIAKE